MKAWSDNMADEREKEVLQRYFFSFSFANVLFVPTNSNIFFVRRLSPNTIPLQNPETLIILQIK